MQEYTGEVADSSDIERSDVEAKNAAAHAKIEIVIQNQIVSSMLSRYPHLDVITEEGSEDSLSCVNPQSPHTLLVDPIDFTRNYLEGGDQYAITAALLDNGTPMITVVEFPGKGERYICRRGHEVLRVKASGSEWVHVRPSASSIIVANKRAMNHLQLDKLNEKYRVEPMQFTLGDVIRCLQGEVSAVLFYGNKAHDVVPAILLALESGAVASDWTSEPLKFHRAALSSDLRVSRGCIVASGLDVSKEVLTAINS
jgi:myo-inositol-1(or 4)-monophosphatase